MILKQYLKTYFKFFYHLICHRQYNIGTCLFSTWIRIFSTNSFLKFDYYGQNSLMFPKPSVWFFQLLIFPLNIWDNVTVYIISYQTYREAKIFQDSELYSSLQNINYWEQPPYIYASAAPQREFTRWVSESKPCLSYRTQHMTACLLFNLDPSEDLT